MFLLREPYPPEVALRLEDGYLAHLGARVGRALPTWNRSILNEIYLYHACSYHEIEDGNGAPGAAHDAL